MKFNIFFSRTLINEEAQLLAKLRARLAHALRDSSVDEVEILDAHPTGLRLDLFNATSDQAVVNPLDHRALSFRGSPAQIF